MHTRLLITLKQSVLLVATLFLFFIFPHSVSAWDNNGGDHGGANWNFTSGNTSIQGTHTNIGNMTISSTATVTAAGDTNLTINGLLWIKDTAILYVNSINNTAQVGGVWAGRGVTISATNLTIDVGAKIDGNGRGYADYKGPGSVSGKRGGAGYGGTGGRGHNSAGYSEQYFVNGGTSYGSSTSPTDLGSGGSDGQYTDVPYPYGGSAIKIILTGEVIINGSISMNGQSGPSGWVYGTGGGSGGSIWLNIVGDISGSGTINAKGANGTIGTYGYTNWGSGGGGAGGRIAIYYGSSHLVNIPTTSTSTSGGAYGGNQSTAGSNGTVIYQLPPGSLITNLVSGTLVSPTSDWTTNAASTRQVGTVNIGIKNNSYRIASSDINFSLDRNWASLVADASSSKSIFYYPGGISSLPGKANNNYTLYVPKIAGANSVFICPNATTLSAVVSGCSGQIFLLSSDSSVTAVTEGGVDYFKVTGITNGGAYTVISGTIASAPANVIPVVYASPSISVEDVPQVGTLNVGVTETGTNTIIAVLNTAFTANRDWSGVTADTEGTKAFFHSTASISTITGGASSTYTLFIPKGDGQKVWICPGAASLNAVSLSCPGGYFLVDGQTVGGVTATVATEGGITYWKISGLTGTGGMSVITGLRDNLTRLKMSTASNHTITFGTNNGLLASTDNIILTFDPDGQAFDLSSIAITDITLTDNVGAIRTLAATHTTNTWGVNINTSLDRITFTAPTSGTGYFTGASQIVIKIGTNTIGGVNQIINPATPGSYRIVITLNNSGTEAGAWAIPIVDSDRVDITGYVTAYIYFDIDTNTDNTDCAYNVCLDFQGGTTATNYTVDLGELKSTYVNKSQQSVNHNGTPGVINSIYFDLTTNGIAGAVVQVRSANGGLQGPGSNFISSVSTDGLDIASNSGKYGYNLPVASTAKYGTVVVNANCNSAVKYCGALNTAWKDVFTTGGNPIDTARVRMDLAAGATYTNNPGTYTDTLTFVATTTF